MKNDSLVSVGVLLNKNVKPEQIKALHSLLKDKYNYFEIILISSSIYIYI